MFRLNKKIKENCIKNNFLGKEINKVECEIQNRLNEIGLSSKFCSYQFILNKFSVKVIVCSKRNVEENMINDLKENYFRKYGLSNLESVISWGNFNKKWDEILYKLKLFASILADAGLPVSLFVSNTFHSPPLELSVLLLKIQAGLNPV